MSRRKGGILIVGYFMKNRSNHFYCEDLANYFLECRYDVAVTSRLLSKIPRLLDSLLSAWRRRQHYQVAIVMVYSRRSFLWAEAVCRLLGLLKKPYVLSLQGGELPVLARKHPKRAGGLLRRAFAVVAPSGYLSHALRSLCPDIKVIPNAFDRKDIRFRAIVRSRPVLLWVRAFHAIYDPQMPVRAVAAIAGRFPDVRLCMVGPDKGDGSLGHTMELVKTLGMQRHVEIRGGIDRREVFRLISKADIFLNTSMVDNFPLSILEAMAAGMCIVSTNAGGIPYMLQDGQDALLVEIGDVDAMSASVISILESSALAQKLSRNAGRKVETFDGSAVFPVWEKVLEPCIR